MKARERLQRILQAARLTLARRLLALLRLLNRIDNAATTERIEGMTYALMSRLNIPITNGTGKCSQCSREVRMLLADAANMDDRRCIRCSPPRWLELYCTAVERTLEKTAAKAN